MGYLIVALISTLGAQAAPAPDFAIRFDNKGCHYEYIDTFKGTYSHVGADAPVPFRLNRGGQMEMVFDALLAADFFNLPEMTPRTRARVRPFPSLSSVEPAGVVPDAPPTETPYGYELEVRNDGIRHTVLWSIGSDWFQSEAGRPLRKVQETIYKILVRL